ncbi:hypothetical protein [Streptomyces sp. MBT97]|uniref:hypothetical protein n=1 Tax=Streptomyces sp. MBT97 TaxID=2800411 RepID=UPI001F49121E|nr:hypothetical protein [Streptomyces sp. MBT97]
MAVALTAARTTAAAEAAAAVVAAAGACGTQDGVAGGVPVMLGAVKLSGVSAGAPVAGAPTEGRPVDGGGTPGDRGAHARGALPGAAVAAGNGRADPLAHAVAVVTAAVFGDRVSETARSVFG